MNGELREFEQATVHVTAHVVQYGSGVFEGIRCYEGKQGSAVFRLQDHLRRLENSAKAYRMRVPYDRGELERAVFETIRANELQACYIRPIVYRGFGTVGISPLAAPIDVAIAVWPWGKYLGDEAAEKGVDVCVSSWRRNGCDATPANAKATANYMNAQLVKMEAVIDGYAEGIALDVHGFVSEGSAENLFLVQDGVLYTPPLSSSILPGITRDSVLVLARDFGLTVREEALPRGMLYTCDEAFFTGTAVEVTPIRTVDRVEVGEGRPGPVTRRLMKEFLGIVRGEVADRHGWLAHVPAAVPQPS